MRSPTATAPLPAATTDSIRPAAKTGLVSACQLEPASVECQTAAVPLSSSPAIPTAKRVVEPIAVIPVTSLWPAGVGAAARTQVVPSGDRQKAVLLTEKGIRWMERAAKQGTLDRSSLAVPYSNLAAMHRKLGADDQAKHFQEMAARIKSEKLK